MWRRGADMLGRSRRQALLAALAALAVHGLAAAGPLRLGSEGIFPPFSRVDSSGDLVGLEPDLAREMCRRMGETCEFRVMEFQALLPSLVLGKFDVLISNLAVTPERQKRLLFTTRVVANPFTYVVPVNSHYEFTPAGLTGHGIRVGLQRGGEQARYLRERFGDSIDYVFYDNTDQAHLDLLAGRINMLFEPKISVALDLLGRPRGEAWKIDGGDHWVETGSATQQVHGNSWAVRRDSAALLQRIDAALLSMMADCTYTRIRQRYLSVPTLPQDADCMARAP